MVTSERVLRLWGCGDLLFFVLALLDAQVSTRVGSSEAVSYMLTQTRTTPNLTQSPGVNDRAKHDGRHRGGSRFSKPGAALTLHTHARAPMNEACFAKWHSLPTLSPSQATNDDRL